MPVPGSVGIAGQLNRSRHPTQYTSPDANDGAHTLAHRGSPSASGETVARIRVVKQLRQHAHASLPGVGNMVGNEQAQPTQQQVSQGEEKADSNNVFEQGSARNQPSGGVIRLGQGFRYELRHNT